MRILNLTWANDDDVSEARLLNVTYDELLSDFRRRMDTALKALGEYETVVQQGSASDGRR